MPAIPQSFTWYEIWIKVYLHPTEQSFREILADPKFHIVRAFLWTMISGVIAAFLVTLANLADGLSLFELLLIAASVGLLVGPVVGTLALVLISIPTVHASGQISEEEGKNRFVYCVAAALAPALLGYGYLISIGLLLVKLSPYFRPILNILALFLTIYFFWLVKNGFNATTKKGLEMPRGIQLINKSLTFNGGLLALAILLYGAFNYAFLEGRNVGQGFHFSFLSWISLGFVVFFAIRVLSVLIERQTAKRLFEQGQVTDGSIINKWQDQWLVSVSRGGDYEVEPRYAYYITVEYSVAGDKHEFTRKVTNDEYMRLAEGCPVKILYLPAEPETVQLLEG